MVDLGGGEEERLLECGLLSTVPYSIVSYWVLVRCSAVCSCSCSVGVNVGGGDGLYLHVSTCSS